MEAKKLSCRHLGGAIAMKFTNRYKEMQRLDRLASLPEGGLAVIWGRRRVGKSRLLLEWCRKYKGVYYTADESSASVQRKYLAIAIDQVLPGFAAVEYPDWRTLFLRLARDAITARWNGPLVLDELPYLISTTPELPSILQKFIDNEAKQANFIIALSGSSQRMMQGAILDASAPLYGRAQELIKLGPISVSYLGEALNVTNPIEIIESYAIWGGIPRYWELVANRGAEFLETIDSIVLDPMGQLFDEPNRLLLEEAPSAISLRPILDAIGLGAHKLSEIAGRIGQQATSLGRPMHRLIELDLVEREIPYGMEEQNSKRALYKIKDPFLRFWFEIVASQRSVLAQTTSFNRKKMLQKVLPSLFALMWEELCRQAIPLLSQIWGDEHFGVAGRYWHGNGPEWDMLAETYDRSHLFIAEAKWTKKAPSASWVSQTVRELKAKGIPPIGCRKECTISYGLFIPEKPQNLEYQPDVRIIDAQEVLAALKQI